MNEAKSLEKHLKLVNSVVVSTNELVNSLKLTNVVDEIIYSTISEIFKFMSKILSLTPELLISNFNKSIKKSDLNQSFEKVIETWSEYFVDPKSFYIAWDEFNIKWNRFNNAVEGVNLSQQTIFLSLN